jgi:HEAT repeat protein
MLLDRDAKMREVAARCLGRFPSGDTVLALERLLERERRPEVRVAAVHALLEQFDAGQEEALRRPLEIMASVNEDARVRVAALALLRMLRATARRAIVARLEGDPSAEVRHLASELNRPGEPSARRTGRALRRTIATLSAREYTTWNQAVESLVHEGSSVVEPLVLEMRRRDHDPEFCNRAGIVLKALGARRCKTLAEALDRVDEPLPLQVLVDVVGTLGEKSLVYRLNDVIERIARRASGSEDGFDPFQHVRALAHFELAKIGSRVAVQDLRAWLSNSEQRLEGAMLDALERIGKRDEIPYLLRAAAREDRTIRERIAEVVRTIVKRERVRRSDPFLVALGARERRAFETIVSAGTASARRTKRPAGRATP